MRLNNLHIIALLLLTVSCNKKNIVDEEIAVLGYMYNSISKELPPPPTK